MRTKALNSDLRFRKTAGRCRWLNRILSKSIFSSSALKGGSHCTELGVLNSLWKNRKLLKKGERKQNLKLYPNHVQAIKTNLAELESQDTPYEVIGTARMQGENDAAKEISAVSYGSNLKKLVAAYRIEFEFP